jgi:beta-lactam-binding protein with PASTA domain
LRLIEFLKSRVFWVNVLLAFFTFVLVIWLALQTLKWYTHHGESVIVPEIKGMNFDKAVVKLDDLDLEYMVIDTSFDPNKSPNSILDQNPLPGSRVKENRVIYLTVNSKTPPNREVPDLIGKSSLKFATIQLESRGFKLGEPIYKPNPDLNAVLDVLYKGRSVKKGEMLPLGSEIVLVLGNGMGNTKIDIPFLIGLTYSEALAVLQENGLTIGALVPDASVSDTTSAKVYKQIPEPNFGDQLRIGEPIDIFIKSTMTQEEIDAIKSTFKVDETLDTGDVTNALSLPK